MDIEEGDGVVLAPSESVLVIALSGPFTPAAIRRIHAASSKLGTGYGQVGVLLLVDPSLISVDAMAHARSKELIAESRDEGYAVAIVVSGRSLFQKLIKTLVAGVQIAARPTAPWRVFTDSELADAISWVTDCAADAGYACDPKRLARTVLAVVQRRSQEHADTVAQRRAPGPPLAEHGSVHEATTRLEQAPLSSGSELPRELGRYTLVEALGAGGMAEAYRAVQSGPGGFEKHLVVKTMLPALASQPQFREMFLREARIAARLASHANVVQVFDAGEVDGAPYIAMELIEGLSLQKLGRRCWDRDQEVPIDVAVAIAADAARGLHHAHHNPAQNGGPLVHRDVSPDNLMVGHDGTTKLLDFGVARVLHDTEQTQQGTVKGKLTFMAPEQLAGRPIDGRADLYALGVTLYWVFAHRRPFEGPRDAALMLKIIETPAPPLRSVAPHVPEAVARVIDRLLSKQPADRFESGQKLAVALEAAVPVRRDAVAELVASLRGVGDAPTAPIAVTTTGTVTQTMLRRRAPRRELAAAALGLTVAAVMIALIAVMVLLR